ncbi:MAG: DUF4062 domain-containing protein [Treponema sp.]|jgi:hypothetical protein|nr:DUF4062 domain-containing protein [Treponema sp.]
MNHLKIFLASSIVEFADDRMSLKNFIRQIENILIDQNIFLRMFICEYADNAIADERKQNEFLREIDDSDIFLILSGKNLGAYTLEEYQYAVSLHERRNDGLPKILAAFKICDELGQSVKDFSAMLSADVERINFKEITELKAALVKVIGTLLPGGLIRVESNKVIIAEKTIKLYNKAGI